MRTEELIKEAKAYNREGCAYIHGEVYKLHAGGIVVSGEEAAIVVTLYSLLEAAAKSCLPDDAGDNDVKKKMLSYIKTFRRFIRIADHMDIVHAFGGEKDEQKI